MIQWEKKLKADLQTRTFPRKQIRPAAVTVDPSTGTIPTGYLIWNVADGALKRHAGGYVWEIGVGAHATAKVGFHGSTPTGQRSGADQAVATDLSSVITLANELRAALVEKELIKGGEFDCLN